MTVIILRTFYPPPGHEGEPLFSIIRAPLLSWWYKKVNWLLRETSGRELMANFEVMIRLNFQKGGRDWWLLINSPTGFRGCLDKVALNFLRLLSRQDYSCLRAELFCARVEEKLKASHSLWWISSCVKAFPLFWSKIYRSLFMQDWVMFKWFIYPPASATWNKVNNNAHWFVPLNFFWADRKRMLSDFCLFSLWPTNFLISPDAFNGLSMVGHLKLAHLDLQSLNSFVFRGLRHVQVSLSEIERSNFPFYSKDVSIFLSVFGLLFSCWASRKAIWAWSGRASSPIWAISGGWVWPTIKSTPSNRSNWRPITASANSTLSAIMSWICPMAGPSAFEVLQHQPTLFQKEWEPRVTTLQQFSPSQSFYVFLFDPP